MRHWFLGDFTVGRVQSSNPHGGQTPSCAPSTKLTQGRQGQPTIVSQLLSVQVPGSPHLILWRVPSTHHSMLCWDLPSVKTKRDWAVSWVVNIKSRCWTVEKQMQGWEQRGGLRWSARSLRGKELHRISVCPKTRAQLCLERRSLEDTTVLDRNLLNCPNVKCYK